ncbi:MAG: diguanylate cyclase [Candidatus Omnitrophica bacterium]|nr:diguanylate cyclase [Candidatus Omnitrophota bacterium]
MPIRGMEDKREMDKERLKELAFIDDLTGLYNRRYLYQYLPTELKDARKAGKKISLFMMDVDALKEINDTYGHLCGDKVLSGIAEILRKTFRGGDTIVRYAGDEFLAILPGAEEDVALKIAKRIIEKIDENPFRQGENKAGIHVTISIGLALFPRDAQDPEQLIYQADRALYSSKRSGRNRICTIKDITAEVLGETKLQEIFPTPQLIGRDNQLSRLKELLDATEKGESKFVLVKGDRGIGKTRLLNELKAFAQLKGITNITATCSPEIAAQPYQILIVALKNLFTSLGAEVREFIRSLPEAQTAQLANYIPTLKQFLPQGFKTIKASLSEQNQVDLFKGICQSLIYIVKRNTLVLIIDDFHWIDKQTLQLFNDIIKDLHNVPLLILAGYREEELENRTDKSSLKELLQKMQQDKLTEEFILGPLKKEEIPGMITATFAGIEVNPNFVDVVYDVGAGNPLFSEEILKSLVKKGFVFYQDGKWCSREITEATLPSFLKETIQKNLSEIDEETKPVLTAAAVMGETFNFDILCQLLEKDPGYVLEVIDRATKQDLIVPERPFQTDRFKFNSGIIRDVIYTGLDLKEKQDLHRKLALIEERAYKDNIDSAAGTIGYHFGKAQDTQKASQYADILLEKASRMPTYQDVFGFLNEAFLEEVEEITVPLSDASMKLVPAMIRSLRLATQNVRLYPAQSAVRKNFVEQAYKCLTDILSKDSTLIISTAENRLLINGEEIGDKASREAGSGAFISLMIEQRIKTIVYKEDLSKKELAIFLEGLGLSFDELISEGGFSGILHKNEVSQIRVNETRYEQTTKLTKQRTKLEEAMLIDYLIGKVSGFDEDKIEAAAQVANDPEKFAQALKKVAEATKAGGAKDNPQAQANIIAKGLQKLNEEVLSQTKGGVGQYRKNIAKAIMALDYNVRSKIIQAQVGADKIATDKTGSSKDIIRDAVEEFSDEEILKMGKKEFSDSPGNLTNLRNLFRRFLSNPQRKQKLLPKLKTELAQMGLTEEEISWVVEEDLWQGLSLEDKVQRAVNITPKKYLKLQKDISEQVDKLISELLENDQYNQVSEIIDKLLRQLDDRSKDVRAVTINDLDKISQKLILEEKYFLLEQIINSLIARLEQEKDPEVYSSTVQLLASICAKLIEKQNFIQATGVLREFNLRMSKTSKLLDIQKQAIKEARDKTLTTPSLINRLTKLLEAKIEGHHDFHELSQVLNEIGTAAIGPLFALGIPKGPYADPFKSYVLRWSIAKVLKDIGDEAVLYLKGRLEDKKRELVKTALEVLGHMQNKTAVTYLHPLLKHKDLHLRKEAIVTLGKIGGSEAIKLLSECIKDKNGQIRWGAIWALSNIGTAEALPLLKPLLKEQEVSEEVKRIIQRIEKK